MNRTKTWLLTLGLLYVLSCTALAQERFTGYEQADIPVPEPEMGDSWFAQPQLSTYGRGPQPPNGVYFNIDYMRLAIQAPEAAFIGQPGSSLTTGVFINEFDNGSRYELGNRVDDKGWLLSGFQISQNQSIRGGNAAIIFGNTGGILGDLFSSYTVHNQVNSWGLEIMRTWRLEPARVPYAPVCEFMFGARYMYFADIYNFDGFSGGSEGVWTTKSENNLVGPQIAMRMSKQYGPWFLSFEPRGFAGFNFQSINQFGELPGSILNVPSAAAFNNSQHNDEFSPVVEIRADIAYLLTRKVKTRFGYTGYWIDNLARAPSMVDYVVPSVLSPAGPAMGINGNNKQDAYIQGIYWGIEVNH